MRAASRSSPGWTSTICLGCNGQWRQRACAVCARHCAVRNADDRVGELTEWQAVEQWAGDGASQKPRPSSTQGSVEVLWVSNAGASIGTATLMAKQPMTDPTRQRSNPTTATRRRRKLGHTARQKQSKGKQGRARLSTPTHGMSARQTCTLQATGRKKAGQSVL
jgi:hypothetical protein